MIMLKLGLSKINNVF